MTNYKRYRNTEDLIAQIAQLHERVESLETAQRLGSSSIDSGQLTLTNGDLAITDANGNVTMRLQHGATPSLYMDPGVVAGGWHSRIQTWESDSSGATLEQRIENSNGFRDGGKLLLNRSTSYLSHQPLVGNECYVAVGAHSTLNSGYSEHFRFRGRWIANDGFDNQDGVVCGYSDIEAGYGAASFAFPFTFDSIPIVVYSLYNSGTAVAHDLSAISASGFTVAWATGTTAKTIGWVAFRR
jgi:hypothetical protein